MNTLPFKVALLTVYYDTPEQYKRQLVADATRLGLDLYSYDITGQKMGYAEGLNKLIQTHINNYDVFFLANPDIDLKGITKGQLLVATGHFDIWGYATHQMGKTYYGGTLDKWRMSGGLQIIKPASRFISCDFISGSFMAVKREVFKSIGFLDESFFMYYEDVEFCTRARLHNFKVGIDSQQFYEHFESSDTNPQKKKWLAQNRFKFLWRYGTWQQKLYEVLRLPKTVGEEWKNLI